MFARVKMTGRPPDKAFVFLTIPRTEGEDYDTTYRHRRMVVTGFIGNEAELQISGFKAIKQTFGRIEMVNWEVFLLPKILRMNAFLGNTTL